MEDKYYNEDKTKALSESFEDVLKSIGENPDREGLLKTPERVAKAMQFLTHGYELNPDDLIKEAIFHEEYSEMVIVKSIELYSLCEHHMLPFFGKIHIAYSPNGRVFGISKLIRLVEKYSKRLQIQERLTKNIADELFAQGVKGVVVVADAQHLCMKMRGVRNDATLTSSAYRGIYENKEEKESIMAMIRKSTSNTSF